jgi:hypothetical protein
MGVCPREDETSESLTFTPTLQPSLKQPSYHGRSRLERGFDHEIYHDTRETHSRTRWKGALSQHDSG